MLLPFEIVVAVRDFTAGALTFAKGPLPAEVAGALLVDATLPAGAFKDELEVEEVGVPVGKANGPDMDEPTVGVSRFEVDMVGELRGDVVVVGGADDGSC